jgi:hypothetical protein
MKTAKKEFTASDFRKELIKIMPGYKWTVRNPSVLTPKDEKNLYLRAEGIQSSGFNRLSTISVERRVSHGLIWYEAKSSGYGVRADWLGEGTGKTLAQALRVLQELYEYRAGLYASAARSLEYGRKKEDPKSHEAA